MSNQNCFIGVVINPVLYQTFSALFTLAHLSDVGLPSLFVTALQNSHVLMKYHFDLKILTNRDALPYASGVYLPI